MREIANSRRTLSLACDEVDKLLLSFITDRAKLANTSHANKLWRRLALRRQKLKEDIFKNGSVNIQWDKRRFSVRLSDFKRDPHFTAFRGALEQNFKSCLTQVELRAAAAGYGEVGIILAGGGASLPFVQAMAARARPSVRTIKRLLLQPLVPDWAKDATFADFAPIFPQVSISIGGAVAHVQTADLHF
jgi:molecular chaperone DnaK (HSP70)